MMMTRQQPRLASVGAAVIAAALVFCVSAPQLLMVVARPVYRVLFGVSDPHVWIANVVWTPISGFPLTTAERIGIPPGVFTLGPFAMWGMFVVPALAGILV